MVKVYNICFFIIYAILIHDLRFEMEGVAFNMHKRITVACMLTKLYKVTLMVMICVY